MLPLSSQRNPSLNYHYEEGKAWLGHCNAGISTTALSYAAFEFRLAIERIVLQYWYALSPGGIEEKDLKDIRSYKSIENRIYQLAGHQKQIDARFEFAHIVLEALKIDWPIITPNLSRFSSYWHQCSELCHVAWTLVSENEKLVQEVYSTLQEISQFLEVYINGVVNWMRVEEMPFREVEEKFITGIATADDIRKYLAEKGAWARVEYADARPPHFIGEAIPPKKV
jgi:hypothetical protein